MERVTGIEPACPAWEVQNWQFADLRKSEEYLIGGDFDYPALPAGNRCFPYHVARLVARIAFPVFLAGHGGQIGRPFAPLDSEVLGKCASVLQIGGPMSQGASSIRTDSSSAEVGGRRAAFQVRKARKLGVTTEWDIEASTRVTFNPECGLWFVGTTMAIPSINNPGSVRNAVVKTDMTEPEPGTWLAAAHVYATDAWNPLGFGDFDSLWERFDEESDDLARVLERVKREYESENLDDEFMLFNRIAILDLVEVPSIFRGMGLGRRAAATALYVAGAWTDSVAVAGIAGAWPEDDGSEDRDAMQARAAHLLESLGLTAYGDPLVYLGTTAHESTYLAIHDLAVG